MLLLAIVSFSYKERRFCKQFSGQLSDKFGCKFNGKWKR